jgi:hypothetical protein
VYCTITSPKGRDISLDAKRASIECDLRHGGSAPAGLLFRPRSILMALLGASWLARAISVFVWMVAVEARLRTLGQFQAPTHATPSTSRPGQRS